MIRIAQIKLPIDYTEDMLYAAAARELGTDRSALRRVTLKKRSVDARKKPDIRYVLTVDVETDNEKRILQKCRNQNVSPARDARYVYPAPGEKKLAHRPVIAGSGPAGLFCALLLARMGYRPLLLERGADADTRARIVKGFWAGDALDTCTNVQFGEGGAGTFSDGKLNTLVKDREGRNRFVLETFVQAGAGEEILYDNKPHIGTDVLQKVVKNLRGEIERMGGEVRFFSQVTDLRFRNGQLAGVTVNEREQIECGVLVLAIGHSARDTFEMLAKRGVPMEQKAFAVGLRIEHPQSFINDTQYGSGHFGNLPAADYKLTGKLSNGRGIYSFCMCPGGYVVNASSEREALAVNGMSYHARDARNANSALVVTVTPRDFGTSDLLGGVAFQRELERFAYRAGGGAIPVQTFADFQNRQKSRVLGEISPCCKGAYALADLRGGLPSFLGDSLEEGILLFDRKIRGFARKDALLLGVESRTSSPLRIIRGTNRMSAICGLYPCGEGAGYAGGITSAAMDGMKTAEAIIREYRKF